MDLLGRPASDLRAAVQEDFHQPDDARLVDLSGSRFFGVSSWRARLGQSTRQAGLIITVLGEPEVTVDNFESAQLVYLLLHDTNIRSVFDTMARKGVLLLGRFTERRIVVLERLRDELRQRGYLPVIFNIDKAETKDFTETVRLLAGMSHFVIADITNPRTAPLELQATVPDIMIPFQPIIEEGEGPFAMMSDLLFRYHWVLAPIYYSTLDALVMALDEKIIRPAEAKFHQLASRRVEGLKARHV
jgi:hypothetical protein